MPPIRCDWSIRCSGINSVRKKTIVLLGMMSKMPVAGNMWLVAQYIVGFTRLGYEVYYVEAHGIRPAGRFLQPGDEYGITGICDFLGSMMRRFDMSTRWAYHALYGNGQCYGLTDQQLDHLYGKADLIINLHGATTPLAEHVATGRLVYLETDPVAAELGIFNGNQQTIDLLTAHNLFFTWGLNYGNSDCGVPLPPGITFHPTCPPIVLDFWDGCQVDARDVFTTIGNWRQRYDRIRFNGSVYHWSKHHEFLKVIDLPSRTQQRFELALSSSSYDTAEQKLLEKHGWCVRDALEISGDMDQYRQYVASSRGEFTVAKDQNVRLRSGWFSERSAQYLAAGRPVITQDTGFSNVLPTEEGLFGFLNLDEIQAAVESINGRYDAHCQSARQLARDYFNYDVVLPRMLADIGL